MEKRTVVEKLYFIEELNEIVPGGVYLTELDKYKRKVIEENVLTNSILLRRFQHKATLVEETERLTRHCKGKGLFLPWRKDEKQMSEVEKIHELTGLDLGFQKKGGFGTSGPIVKSLVVFMFMLLIVFSKKGVTSLDYLMGNETGHFLLFLFVVVAWISFARVFSNRRTLYKRKEEAAYLDQEINRLN